MVADVVAHARKPGVKKKLSEFSFSDDINRIRV
jgi:hypothetical protein